MSNNPLLDETEDMTTPGALDAPTSPTLTLPERAEKRGFGASFGSLFNRPGSSEALIAFGANMLSANSFGEGLGRGAMAFADTLRAEEERRKPKQQFLADGAIMASTDPMTGETDFQSVDPVQQYIAARDQAELEAFTAKEGFKQEHKEALLDQRYDRMDQQLAERAEQRAREQDAAFERRMDLMMAQQDRQDARSYGLAAYRAALDSKNGGGDSGGRLLDSRNAKEILSHADTAETVDRIFDTYEDDFSGKPATDGLVNFIGKYTGKKISVDLPVVGKVELSDPRQAQWWQDYADFTGQLRNQRFGATLTNNEKRDFEKLIVTPGMDSKTVRANLARQRQIMLTSLARRMRVAAKGGYNSDQVIEAGGDVGLEALEEIPSAREAPRTKPSTPTNRERTVTVPKAHIDYLIKNPNTAAQFDAKYGKGAAAAFVRKRQGKR